MCGIAGFHRFSAPDDQRRTVLQRMIGTLRHRGPDGEGAFHGGDVGLAHVRLSIIDVASGQQPMSNEDGSVWITFNGEVFNYLELREGLIERGHVFKTASDTEVIVHLYEERGADCVRDLNGDFAFAIWDGRRRQMVLARDRAGVRPLFYAERNGAIFFASEIKALLQVPGVSAELDPLALDQIFTFWFPLPPRTPFKGIRELPPAHVLVATSRGTASRPYWRLEFPPAADAAAVNPRTERKTAEELRDLLMDATRSRLRADVPIGAYLSGGLDSSITTAAIKRLVPDQLRSFSVAFEDAEFDESAFQKEMVEQLATQHASVLCHRSDIAGSFAKVIYHTERPILRTAPVPLMMLSRLVHEAGIKVVLTGEGADEVFAGYDIFKEAMVRRFCARQPGSPRRLLLLRRLYPYLPRLQVQSQRYLEAFFSVDLLATQDPLYSHLPRFRTTSGVKAFYSRDMRASIDGYDPLADLRECLPPEFATWHPLSQSQYLETAHLLPGYILSSQGDRVSMAHAVEGRFPFLDHRVIECAARIPPRLKLNGLREKYILRESMRHLLPAAIVERPKQPYRAPEARAFFDPGGPEGVLQDMAPQRIAEAGHFDHRLVTQLVDKCKRWNSLSFRDNMAFVGVLSTQVWSRLFKEAPSRAVSVHQRPG
jgi:asparagine synthase (glutamine-hydrolysing)